MALEMAPGALPGDAAIGAVEAWDSLAHMRLVLALEEAVGGELEAAEIVGIEGGVTRHLPDGETMPIFDAAMKYKAEGVPLVVVGGTAYGTGSSRDWAAKGTLLLGIKAVIVESFERIHRSNLIGMGILPLEFRPGVSRKTLGLDGTEVFDIAGIAAGITPRMDVACKITRADGKTEEIPLTCRIDTIDEAEYYRHGGILQYVLRNLAKEGGEESPLPV